MLWARQTLSILLPLSASRRDTDDLFGGVSLLLHGRFLSLWVRNLSLNLDQWQGPQSEAGDDQRQFLLEATQLDAAPSLVQR